MTISENYNQKLRFAFQQQLKNLKQRIFLEKAWQHGYLYKNEPKFITEKFSLFCADPEFVSHLNTILDAIYSPMPELEKKLLDFFLSFPSSEKGEGLLVDWSSSIFSLRPLYSVSPVIPQICELIWYIDEDGLDYTYHLDIAHLLAAIESYKSKLYNIEIWESCLWQASNDCYHVLQNEKAEQKRKMTEAEHRHMGVINDQKKSL